jgi:hypothetical protein
MINFFRKIRKKLADDNKPLKYMRYAIGEIVLVVIGILLALQVNNWNENRKERIKEKQILQSLLEDFKSNDASLDSVLIGISEQIDNWTIVLSLAGASNEELNDSIKDRVVNTNFTFANIVDGTLSSVLTSDKLELIENSKLKKLLTAYPTYIDGYRETENNIQKYVINIQRPIIRSYISLGDFRVFMPDEKEYEVYKKKVEPSDYKGLLENREYLNVIIGVRQNNRRLLSQRNILQSRTKEIIAVIENESVQ